MGESEVKRGRRTHLMGKEGVGGRRGRGGGAVKVVGRGEGVNTVVPKLSERRSATCCLMTSSGVPSSSCHLVTPLTV